MISFINLAKCLESFHPYLKSTMTYILKERGVIELNRNIFGLYRSPGILLNLVLKMVERFGNYQNKELSPF